MRVIQGANRKHVAMVEGGGTSVASGSNVRLDYDNVIKDQTGLFDTSLNRYYAPETGMYYVHATVRSPSPTNNARHDMAIRINGSVYAGEGRNQQGANDAGCSVTAVVPLSAGQYIDILYNQNTNTTITTNTTSNVGGTFTLGTTSLFVFMVSAGH